MRDTPLRTGEEPAAASLAACIASILELDDAPGTLDALDPWLATRGLGLAAVRAPEAFAWAGPWVARVRCREGRTGHVVRYGVPSGTAWDPAGLGSDAVVEEGWVLAALDPLRGRRAVVAGTGVTGTVVALAIAAEREGPVTLVDAAEALAGLGLEGDRYARGAGTFPSPGDGAALTLIAAEVVGSFDPPLRPDEHRRNVITEGVDLDALVGRKFLLGDVLCSGRRPAQPCAHLQRLAARPLLRPLVHRGGLRADVLTGGTIRLGDAITTP